MIVEREEIQQRLGFIDRTIYHAIRACDTSGNIPDELRDYVQQLGQRSSQARQALESDDDRSVRETVDDLARISYQAQRRIHPADGMNYELKSAVILAHIELSALRYQLA
ncbi:hypothetical protein [Noviherbaspirillum denitrificans]|uniref:Uncharacterized protein n=1 Tax=Noviherbaspirillum denitrificans TaxID=1968433 RepID=A0A254TFH2_9BURK|nr:hypothetical protein [Noviherbaspirillum denitrificans]OWW20917.1 hypothetical protein AYR66_17025 [Noviherbaspirillum denitrificans]